MRYLVVYKVFGKDHDGYCSDVEDDNEDERDLGISFEIIKQKKNLKDLHYTNDSCTSDGSGYCNGYQQRYTAVDIIEISEEYEQILCGNDATIRNQSSRSMNRAYISSNIISSDKNINVYKLIANVDKDATIFSDNRFSCITPPMSPMS